MIVRLTYLCLGEIVETQTLGRATGDCEDHPFIPGFVIDAPYGYALNTIRAVATSPQEPSIQEYYIYMTKVSA